MTLARLICTLVLVVIPDLALAHTSAPGLGGFTAAMIHAVTEAPAPLALIALGLQFGQLDEAKLGSVFAAFSLAMVAAIAVTYVAQVYIDQEFPLVALALLAGLGTASALRLSYAVAVGMAVVAGYFFGVLATPDPAPLSIVAYSVVGGLVGACWMLMGIAAAVHMTLKRWDEPWMRIGVRIIGSWIVAISTLLLALQMAPVRGG